MKRIGRTMGNLGCSYETGIERTSVDIVASTFRSMTKKEGGSRDAAFPTQEPVAMTNNSGNEPVFEIVAPSGDAPTPQGGDDLPF